MRKLMFFTILFAVLILVYPRASAQGKSTEVSMASVKGFRAEFLVQMSEVEKKLVDLAQAEPQEKFTWRPSEGVRSISEVYMHIAGGNYLFPSVIGIKPPSPMEPDMEKKFTDKAKVIDFLKQSFGHLRGFFLSRGSRVIEDQYSEKNGIEHQFSHKQLLYDDRTGWIAFLSGWPQDKNSEER